MLRQDAIERDDRQGYGLRAVLETAPREHCEVFGD